LSEDSPLVVVLQNTQPAETRLLFMAITIPSAVLLAETVAVGIMLGLVMFRR
jgi:hypothetical protein